MVVHNRTFAKEPLYRRAIAELSGRSLLSNLSTMQRVSGSSQIIAMVKANAYGHGIRSVSRRLDGKVFALGVASIDEAVVLRESGIASKIILMEGVISADDLTTVEDLDLDLVIHDFSHLDWILQKETKLSDVWVKIDIGMGRLGFFPKDLAKVLQSVESINNLIKGKVRLMGHLSDADQPKSDVNCDQVGVFSQIVSAQPFEASLCNSAAIFGLPNNHYDFVRPGLALYGESPILSRSAQELGLQPVMTVKSRLIAVKQYPKGHHIGYGHTFTCPKDMKVGVISFGYGDGYPRSVKTGAPVLVNGVLCPLVGRISMDMMTVDVSNCPSAAIGTEVVLWGEGLPISVLEKHSGISRYELFTSVQNRVKFIWNDC